MEQLVKVLANTLKEIKDHSNREMAPSYTTSIDVPRFDPAVDSDGAEKWCLEIEPVGSIFKWTDFEQLTRASGGLVGEAGEWFSACQPETKDWEHFKVEFQNLYPPKKSLSEKLLKASLYSSDQAASYCDYAKKKVSLLKALNFQFNDAQMLEIVIGDIKDV